MNDAIAIPGGSAATPPVREDLRIAAWLGLASGLATAALFPYLQLIMPEAMAKLPMSLPMAIALQSLQSTLLLGLLAFWGLRMGHRLGLGAPWLRALATKRERPRQPWLLAVAVGIAVGLAIVGIDPLFAPHMPTPLRPLPETAPEGHALAGFLASFYGGICEEILLRLFFVSLLAWGFWRLASGRLARWHLVAAVVIAALAFGAGHLPAAAQVWPLDAVVVSRTLVLNALAGLAFGWFYCRHGLESAILAHFAADIVLHVLVPLARLG
jgi:membrane protease YdiL (CAAX protease family)